MDLNTTIKYLEFVSNECDRHLKDGIVSDDELNQLIIEFNRFQDKIRESSLPNEIKNEIQKLEFEYDSKKIKRNSLILILTVLTFGSWGYLLEMRKQSIRKRTLEDLKRNTTSIGFKVKLNY